LEYIVSIIVEIMSFQGLVFYLLLLEMEYDCSNYIRDYMFLEISLRLHLDHYKQQDKPSSS